MLCLFLFGCLVGFKYYYIFYSILCVYLYIYEVNVSPENSFSFFFLINFATVESLFPPGSCLPCTKGCSTVCVSEQEELKS